MGVNEGNLQVIDRCRNDNGKLSNGYSYVRYVPVAIMVLTIHAISYIRDSRSKR